MAFHQPLCWFAAAAKSLCQVYQQAPEAARRGELTFSVDGMTGIQALARIAPDHPMQPGQPVRREFEYVRHGTLSLLAGLDVAEGKIQALGRPTRTETDFVDLVAGIVQAQPEASKFTFVLDNLNTHQSESLVQAGPQFDPQSRSTLCLCLSLSNTVPQLEKRPTRPNPACSILSLGPIPSRTYAAMY